MKFRQNNIYIYIYIYIVAYTVTSNNIQLLNVTTYF